MPDMTDELNEIGAALAAAASGSSVALSASQHAVLASAPTADVLFSIAQYIPDLKEVVLPTRKGSHLSALALDQLRATDQRFTMIATEWANECRVAFADPLTERRIAAALATEQPLAGIADLIQDDNRLASYERDALLHILHSTNSKRRDMRGDTASPKTAYISQLSVAGFRGIGTRAELNIEPHPGLAIVYGANGSGKSSFVEALDVLLTGTTGRFSGRGAEWRSAQTNVHEPDGGYVRGVFTLGTHGTKPKSLVRSWTGDGYLTGTYDETPTNDMQALGWLDALDEFKPILGYAELGPLLDEGTSDDTSDSNLTGQRETPLARHIRLRAGIDDPLISSFQEAVQNNGTTTDRPFLQELVAWYRLGLLLSVPGGKVRLPTNDGLGVQLTLNRKRKDGLTALVPLSGQSLPHPRELDWDAFFDITSVYNSSFDDFVALIVAPLLDLCRDFTTNDHRLIRAPQETTRGWTSRTHVYCEMLIEAIYRARLATLSEQVGDVWRRIRPGGSVQLHGIELRTMSQAYQSPVFRASLDLSLDGVRGVGRGVLSQGELHSMALSVFLPTMMRPESPFGFAVIDDPVQVMDEHAVEGLAEVLLDAAKELQVIVFTHDTRLIRAIRLLDFEDRTRIINVTRSAGSVVHCEPALDPAEQALNRARIEAARPVDEDSWVNVAFHCRQAVEHACIEAGRRKLRAASMSSADIRDALDEPKQHERHTTRMLMAIAIWGQAALWQNVRRHVSKTERDQWGGWVDRLIDRLNVLVHDEDEQKIAEARVAYGGNLEDLISESAQLVKKIGENCV